MANKYNRVGNGSRTEAGSEWGSRPEQGPSFDDLNKLLDEIRQENAELRQAISAANSENEQLHQKINQLEQRVADLPPIDEVDEQPEQSAQPTEEESKIEDKQASQTWSAFELSSDVQFDPDEYSRFLHEYDPSLDEDYDIEQSVIDDATKQTDARRPHEPSKRQSPDEDKGDGHDEKEQTKPEAVISPELKAVQVPVDSESARQILSGENLAGVQDLMSQRHHDLPPQEVLRKMAEKYVSGDEEGVAEIFQAWANTAGYGWRDPLNPDDSCRQVLDMIDPTSPTSSEQIRQAQAELPKLDKRSGKRSKEQLDKRPNIVKRAAGIVFNHLPPWARKAVVGLTIGGIALLASSNIASAASNKMTDTSSKNAMERTVSKDELDLLTADTLTNAVDDAMANFGPQIKDAMHGAETEAVGFEVRHYDANNLPANDYSYWGEQNADGTWDLSKKISGTAYTAPIDTSSKESIYNGVMDSCEHNNEHLAMMLGQLAPDKMEEWGVSDDVNTFADELSGDAELRAKALEALSTRLAYGDITEYTLPDGTVVRNSGIARTQSMDMELVTSVMNASNREVIAAQYGEYNVVFLADCCNVVFTIDNEVVNIVTVERTTPTQTQKAEKTVQEAKHEDEQSGQEDGSSGGDEEETTDKTHEEGGGEDEKKSPKETTKVNDRFGEEGKVTVNEQTGGVTNPSGVTEGEAPQGQMESQADQETQQSTQHIQQQQGQAVQPNAGTGEQVVETPSQPVQHEVTGTGQQVSTTGGTYIQGQNGTNSVQNAEIQQPTEVTTEEVHDASQGAAVSSTGEYNGQTGNASEDSSSGNIGI